MKQDASKQNLQAIMASQYKVFRLTEDGTEEIDFVEWASDINRNHPIARNYQNLRKNYFDRLRKERAATSNTTMHKDYRDASTNSQTLSTIHQRNNTGRITPQSLKGIGNRDLTPFLRNKTSISRNNTSNLKRIRLTFDNSKNYLTSSTIDPTPVKHDNNLATNSSPVNWDTTSKFTLNNNLRHSKSSYKQRNLITQNFDISKSKLLSQVRKHLNLVTDANTFQNNFMHNDEAKHFQTPNPINVYYQIAQNQDYNFKTYELLKPTDKADVENLREDYLQRCNMDTRQAKFEKSDYMPERQIMTSYQGKRKQNVIMKQLQEQQRCQSVVENYNQSIQAQEIEQSQQLKQKRLSQKSMHISNSKSKNNINHSEPEMPLTGYNYQRYFNEGQIIFKAARSANKIKGLIDKMDKDMIQRRQEELKLKYQVLAKRVVQKQMTNININNNQGNVTYDQINNY